MKVRYVGRSPEGVVVPCVVDGYEQLVHVEHGGELDVTDDQMAAGLLAQEGTWEATDPEGRKVAKKMAEALEQRRALRAAGGQLSTAEAVEAEHQRRSRGGSPRVHDEPAVPAAAVAEG